MQGQNQTHSEIVEIAKLTGEFSKHYGKLIGAYLYLRSLNASRSRSFLWGGVLFALLSGAVAWAEQHGWPSFAWLARATGRPVF